jgi:hypothetical protein
MLAHPEAVEAQAVGEGPVSHAFSRFPGQLSKIVVNSAANGELDAIRPPTQTALTGVARGIRFLSHTFSVFLHY